MLHPVLSSKSVKFTSKLLKGFLKATVKLDLDDDKSESSLTAQTPDIKLIEYLNNSKDYILIFDDLERCKIDINNTLGYINYFVEHQKQKVIIIANEKEIKNKDEENIEYTRIKEKLIGKTLEVKSDANSAFDNFIGNIKSSWENKVKPEYTTEDLLIKYKDVILNIHKMSKYDNLRVLKQLIYDFDRLYLKMSKKILEDEEVVKEFLINFLIYSIEYKQGRYNGFFKELFEGYYLSRNELIEKATKRGFKLASKSKKNNLGEVFKEDTSLIEDDEDLMYDKYKGLIISEFTNFQTKWSEISCR